jgi:hypothetical protein
MSGSATAIPPGAFPWGAAGPALFVNVLTSVRGLLYLTTPTKNTAAGLGAAGSTSVGSSNTLHPNRDRSRTDRADRVTHQQINPSHSVV